MSLSRLSTSPRSSIHSVISSQRSPIYAYYARPHAPPPSSSLSRCSEISKSLLSTRRRGWNWTTTPPPHTPAGSVARYTSLSSMTTPALSSRSSNYTPLAPRASQSVNAIFTTFVPYSGSSPRRDVAYKIYRSLWMKTVSAVRCPPVNYFNMSPREVSGAFAPGLHGARASLAQRCRPNCLISPHFRFNLLHLLAPFQKPYPQASNNRENGARCCPY